MVNCWALPHFCGLKIGNIYQSEPYNCVNLYVDLVHRSSAYWIKTPPPPHIHGCVAPLKLVACHIVIEFILLNICCSSAVTLNSEPTGGKNLFWLGNAGQWSNDGFHGVTCCSISPYCTCSLGLHVSSERSRWLACCHFLHFSWQDIGFMKEKENAVCRGDVGKRGTMDKCHPNVPCCSVQVCLPWSVYLSQCQHSLVSGLTGPRQREIIHLFLHLRPGKPFITRPETSINYSDGRKSGDRQIHLDLIGKQVCSRPLSRSPLR